MKKKYLLTWVVIASLALFASGCSMRQLVQTAISAGVAYGLSQISD